MNLHVETKRLLLRDLEESDVQGIFELDSDPEVHRFLGNNPIQTIDQALADIHYVRNQYEKNSIGRWAIEDKQTRDFIGWTGLKYETHFRDGFNYYDLGYRLCRKYWGKGIATESALASLEYGFNTMNLEQINAAAEIRHTASNRILQKVGLNITDTIEYQGIMHNWYELKKNEYLHA